VVVNTADEPETDIQGKLVVAAKAPHSAPRWAVELYMLAALRAINLKNVQRNKRLDALEAAVKEKRITGVRWAGVYETGRTYREGEMAQKNGLWIATVPETMAAPGTAPKDWKLLVHAKVMPKEPR